MTDQELKQKIKSGRTTEAQMEIFNRLLVLEGKNPEDVVTEREQAALDKAAEDDARQAEIDAQEAAEQEQQQQEEAPPVE